MHCCYLERAVITANPPSKVFPQDNYCFSDSSCRPCPSLFAQNILLPAIFLGQARATHVTSSWACRQEAMDLKVSSLGWPASVRCVAHRTPPGSRAGPPRAAAVLENLPAPVFGGKHYHQHILACNLPRLLSSSIGLMLMVQF